jgi:hypothetical protein
MRFRLRRAQSLLKLCGGKTCRKVPDSCIYATDFFLYGQRCPGFRLSIFNKLNDIDNVQNSIRDAGLHCELTQGFCGFCRSYNTWRTAPQNKRGFRAS